MVVKRDTSNKNSIKNENMPGNRKRKRNDIKALDSEKKRRKLKRNKIENDGEKNKPADTDSEFNIFIDNFAIPSNIYKHLYSRNQPNKFFLKRCLPYNTSKRTGIIRSTVNSIADHLTKVILHDPTSNASNLKNSNPPVKLKIKFEQFIDSQTDKTWKTVKASIYIDVVHFYRDNRKNTGGYYAVRAVENHEISCNKIETDVENYLVLDAGKYMKGVSNYRVYKSSLNIKILVKEEKLSLKNLINDKKFEATYEVIIPFLSNKKHCLIEPGKYEVYPKVTCMDLCDDSLYSGWKPDCNLTNDDVIDESDCTWGKLDDGDLDAIGVGRAKVVFTISNENPRKSSQNALKLVNGNAHKVVKKSPRKSRELSQLKIKNEEFKNIRIVFSFKINNKIAQWSKLKNFRCPWCQFNFIIEKDLFINLTKMMQHLNYMHPKFTFTCSKLSDRATFFKYYQKEDFTIDVTLTKGSANDLDFGAVLTAEYPVRRMPLTLVIYTKYGVPAPTLHRPNHPREYCHTWSSRKDKYLEFDIDSEDEENMTWIYDHYSRKVEEFTDLNHIEKRVIQIWNESLLKYGLTLGDHQMGNFAEQFILDLCDRGPKAKEARGLRNTLMLHLVNLIDYGVLPPATFLRCMRLFDDRVCRVAV